MWLKESLKKKSSRIAGLNPDALIKWTNARVPDLLLRCKLNLGPACVRVKQQQRILRAAPGTIQENDFYCEHFTDKVLPTDLINTTFTQITHEARRTPQTWALKKQSDVFVINCFFGCCWQISDYIPRPRLRDAVMMRRLWPDVYLHAGAITHNDGPSAPAGSGSVLTADQTHICLVGSFQQINTVFPPSRESITLLLASLLRLLLAAVVADL